jgi:ABC-type dipeptide/oligopeptide/nickel transport system ATPase component
MGPAIASALIALVLAIVLPAATPGGEASHAVKPALPGDKPGDLFPDKARLRFAHGFTLEYHGTTKRLEVRQPWRDARWRELRGRRMAIILQNPVSAFDPVLTIGEHFKETISAHAGTPRRSWPSVAEGLLHSVGLPSPGAMLRLYPFQMSGGMLQWVCIARAIVPQPRLVVLDEAVSGLDMIVQAQMLEFLSDLQSRLNMAFLFISHDIRLIRRMCDQVAVLHRGRILECCLEMTALDQVSHEASKALLRAILPAFPV